MLTQHNLNHARDTLKRANIKVTLHRLLIFKILENTNHALTAYEIEHALIALGHHINLATIYSTLKIFQNIGLLQRYKISTDQATYSLNKKPVAIQFKCQHCGSLHCIAHEQTKQHVHTLCTQHHVNLVDYHMMIYIQTCKYCQITNS